MQKAKTISRWSSLLARTCAVRGGVGFVRAGAPHVWAQCVPGTIRVFLRRCVELCCATLNNVATRGGGVKLLRIRFAFAVADDGLRQTGEEF